MNGLFQASAFPTPTLGAERDLGRNTYDRRGYNNVNFAATKFFDIPWFFGDKMKIELKGEFVNLFNRVNLSGVDPNLPDSLIGHSTSQLPARSIQLHLRASF
jgi:hypothetical protein